LTSRNYDELHIFYGNSKPYLFLGLCLWPLAVLKKWDVTGWLLKTNSEGRHVVSRILRLASFVLHFSSSGSGNPPWKIRLAQKKSIKIRKRIMATEEIIAATASGIVGGSSITVATISTTVPAAGIAGWFGITTVSTITVALPVAGIVGAVYVAYKAYKYISENPWG
jgi:hypothetical protein